MATNGRPKGAPRLRAPAKSNNSNNAKSSAAKRRGYSAHRVLPKGLVALYELSMELEHEKMAAAVARQRGNSLVAAYHAHRIAELRREIAAVKRRR